MRFDVLDQLSAAQVVTAAAVSTNSKKVKTIGQDLGVGECELGLAFAAVSDAVGGGSFTIEIIEATDAALTAGVVSLASMTLTAAKLLAGVGFFLPLPGYVQTKQFYGARFTPVGGTSPSLTVDAYFGSDEDVAQYKAFTSTYTVAN